jgi:hypothetical protein
MVRAERGKDLTVNPKAILLLGIAAVLFLACGDEPSPVHDPELRTRYAVPAGTRHVESSAPCAASNPERNAYFGDLHVHTSISSDAFMFDVRVTPNDAYGYAFGEPIRLPDDEGYHNREVRIDRPLDFAAVTDHAEFMGESLLCKDPESPGYDADLCVALRTEVGRPISFLKYIGLPFTWREDEICGADGEACRQAAADVWQQTIDAAGRWNDESEGCERTTFIAYEYSSHRLGSNLHRNVIFRNRAVPALPISYIEATREWQLWELLKEGCLESESGCDVISIPHNSNISNGRMFNVDFIDADTLDAQVARAKLQIELEPIIELMQHKGDSECRDGITGVLGSEDELCRFEKFESMTSKMRFGAELTLDDTCPDGWWGDKKPHLGPDCLHRLSYGRYALIEGLAQERRIGVNPFKFGFTASTDTHNGLAGGVEERSYPGHLGIGDSDVAKRTAFDPGIEGNTSNSPGGLTGAWATENSREAIFAAMKRKEVFGTSGPRIEPRFFGGWALPPDLCDAPNMLARADASAVPMGGDLVKRPAGQQASPVFLAAALADPGADAFPGTPLQRLQIVKGWVDAEGQQHEKVYDVAGDPDNGADVNVDTCEQSGSGFGQLCAVWSDPEFDPNVSAVYYMRAVENPSCRYNAWQCVGLSGADRPAGCDDPNPPRKLQERAWTSPIWYTARTGR